MAACERPVCFISVGLSISSVLSLMFSLGLLESVLFSTLRFHDTISRGRLLNRFGKDFEGTLCGFHLRTVPH